MSCATQKNPSADSGAVAISILRAALKGQPVLDDVEGEPGSLPDPVGALIDTGRGIYVLGQGPAEIVVEIPGGLVLARLVGTDRRAWTRRTLSPTHVTTEF